ncbi:helix-turn-helix domain-containing protein [Desulfosporosinus nitroreducens]|uniref:helix-turn-helix domain-containing protein n=1 Tax=Desulfosporosinus nitroreducens TaxID=2018668 RepID=UPI0035A322C4
MTHLRLRSYFECKYNAVAAAKKLFIQRSSFFYRMNKIREMVNIDFDSNDEMLYLAISLEILKEYHREKTV